MNQESIENTTDCAAGSADKTAATPAAGTEIPETGGSDTSGSEADDSKLINVAKEDQTDIAKNLQLLFGHSLVEIRAISQTEKCHKLMGYYDEYELAAAAIAPWNGKRNIFVTLHNIADVPPAVTDKYYNPAALLPTHGKDVSVTSEHIDRYNYFLIDIDPVKPAGEECSATKEEAKACMTKAKAIRSWLMHTLQFPDCIMAFSGNGAHLLYNLDLPVDEAHDTYKLALRALAQKFDDNDSIVDERIFDPVRSVKVYGTIACKGEHTKERPHRQSRILHIPRVLADVPLDKLRALAANYVKPQQATPVKQGSNGADDNKFDATNFAKEITKDSDTFIDTCTGLPYITVKTSSGRYLTCEIEGGLFRDYLLAETKMQTGCYLNGRAFDGFITTTAAITRLKKQKKEVATRIMKLGNAIFYNLMDPNHQVVMVTPAQVTIANPMAMKNGIQLKFNESTIMEAQAVPRTADTRPLQDVLGQYLNLTPDDKVLAIVTLITWFLPHIERAILLLNGPQGTGKSFLSQIIQRIVDPVSHDLPPLPTDMQELQLILSEYYLVAFDNISQIREAISNTLCKSVTGGTQIKRKLYSDKNLVILTYKNCVILNGIGDFVQMPDLLDRIVTLKTIPHGANKSKVALLAQFQKDLPDIMAKIFTILQQAMAVYPTVDIDTPTRLVEYEKWGYAIAQVIYGDGNTFLKAYYKGRYLTSISRAENDAVGNTFLRYANLQQTLPVYIPSRKVYDDLCVLGKGSYNRLPADWPKDPSAMTSRLERLLMNLQDSGYTFRKVRYQKKRQLCIDVYPPADDATN